MRLPAELLSMIFVLSQRLPRDGRVSYAGAYHSPPYPPNWNPVLHVCREWRRVATSYAALWRHIVVDEEILPRGSEFPYLPRSALQLSAQSPLSVSIYLQEHGSDDVVSEVFAQMHRIEELSLFGAVSSTRLQQLLSAPAPRLKSLSLQMSIRKSKVELGGELSSETLPTLFQGCCPLLRSLSLRSLMCYSENAFKNLKRLQLVSGLHSSDDFSKFLDLLDAITTLEELVFTDALLGVDETDTPITRTSHVPNLRMLLFDSSYMPSTATILASLRTTFPLAVTIRPHELREEHQLCSLDYFFAPHRRILRGFSEVTMLRVLFDGSTSESLHVTFAGPAFALRAEHCRFGELLCSDTEPSQDLCEILSNVEELWVAASPGYGWLRSQCEDRALCCIGPYVHRLRKLVLGENIDDLANDFLLWLIAESPLDYPNLVEIHVHEPWPAVWNPLLECLQSRMAAGCPIEILKVYTSDKYQNSYTWERWKEERNEFDQCVQNAEILYVHQYPKAPLPPVCAHRSDGPWGWPSWENVGELGAS